jgi:hypothetical protein
LVVVGEGEARSPGRSWICDWVGRHGRSIPVVLATAVLFAIATWNVLDRCGHPAVPLDDAFIHFQYAKRLATGHFFSYSPGDGYSSGATSFAWPLVLAPFYALGLRDLWIIWAAWGLSWAALGALSVETYRLAEKLAGRGPALGSGAMVLAFGGYVWCASSGMEVVPLAWLLALGARLSAEWGETLPSERTAGRLRAMLLVANAAPLVRPEGMLVSLLVALSLVVFPAGVSVREVFWRPGPVGVARGRGGIGRAFCIAAFAGALVPPVLNWILAGHAASSTTLVKWLPTNPYHADRGALVHAIGYNVRLLVESILDGREWSAIFVPAGARPFALLALICIPIAGAARRRVWRASIVFLVVLGILIPCTYSTFLWNRLRYLWPFAFAWFIGLGCLARAVGVLLARLHPRMISAGTMLSGLFAGALASHLSWTLQDLATSASAIDQQQVLLGRWASENLDAGAVVGVNDTGAIAYVGNRRTFDIVGLTTPGEAPYWVAGPGSRFEHYERLFRASPAALPSHFIVYPNWMGCDALLGAELHEATVTDQTILGAPTMTAYRARYDLLWSGAAPLSPPAAVLIDELDVSDLESEREHDYDVGAGKETENLALKCVAAGKGVVDGGRVRREFDRFVAHLRPGVATIAVARLPSEGEAKVLVRVADREVSEIDVPASGWYEPTFMIPADIASRATPISLRAQGEDTFGSAHYWFYEAPASPPRTGP